MEEVNVKNNHPAPAGSNSQEIIIEIRGLKKAFGDKEVLKDINLNVKRGQNLVVLGRSGQGKSVTIQCIVGMLTPDAGSVKVFGEEVAELSEENLKELRTKIGFLFQGAALFDSMTVKENLEFPLTRVLKLTDQADIDRRIKIALEGVGLPESGDKLPSDLSGGMRKRIGLARTLVVNPEIMLYDEPTTGLDPVTSREISQLILQVQKKYKTTSIIITHDMECAKITGDYVVVMDGGVYIAEGTFKELQQSDNELVKSFFNETL